MTRCIVRAVVLPVCASLGLVANADQPDPMQDARPAVLELIIVTGSRIPRRDFFSTSPIVTLERAELEIAGTSEIKNLLNDLPQVDPTVDAGTSNSFGGESFVNLRALGADRTLVLLDGRRYPSQGGSNSIDLNAVPPVLIEKIEIITGGASSVYGSDAIAGAVNFVLRRDFAGLESNLQYDLTARGDGEKSHFDITYGTPFADGRGNLVLFADYFRRTAIFQDARSFSRVQVTSNDNTGELFEFGSFASAAASIAGIGPFYTFEPDGRPRLYVEPDDRFNLSGFDPLLAPMERYSVNLLGQYETQSALRTRFDLSYARSLPVSMVPDEFFGFVNVNADRPDLAPEFSTLLARDADPDGDGIATVFLARTFSPERGTGTVEYETNFYRGLLGIEGELGTDWYWNADLSYSANDRNSRALNDISVSRIRQGLLVDAATGGCIDASRGCVPVNPFGRGNLSAAAANFIGLAGTAFTERSRETFVTAGARGPAAQLRHGELELAAGVEYRQFRFRNVFPNNNLETGDSLFFPNTVSPTDGTIAIREAFMEARVPMLSDSKWANYVGLELGVRASDYNTVGDVVWTSKLGLEWEVTDALRLRIMRQRAIRAPGMTVLFQGTNFSFTDFDFGPVFDECSASRDPVGNGLADLCIAQGIPADQIGIFEANPFPVAVSFASNPRAQPETAETLSAGFVWQAPGDTELSTSVDYFRIDIDDALGTADHMDLARLCFLGRDPTDPACQTFTRGPSGDIDSGSITTINTAFATSEGIDVAVRFQLDTNRRALIGREAQLSLSLLATHYLKAGSQGSVLLPFLDCAGKFGAFCGLFAYQGAVPDWRATTRLTYDTGPFSASLRWSHIGGLANAETEFRRINGLPPPVLGVPSVPAEDYLDLSFSWRFRQNVTLNFGIENLLDEEPPLLGNAAKDANTDPTTYDVLGRRYFLRAKLSY